MMAPKKLPGGMRDGTSGNLHGLGVLGTGQGLQDLDILVRWRMMT